MSLYLIMWLAVGIYLILRASRSHNPRFAITGFLVSTFVSYYYGWLAGLLALAFFYWLIFNDFPIRATGPSKSALELAFWQSIENSQNPADFYAYLNKYPGGQFNVLARNRLAELNKKSSAA